jgi:hypothetical protein
MVDPISLVGLVGTAFQLADSAKKVCGYVSDVKQASEERQALSAELALLQPFLEELKRLSDHDPSIYTDPDDPHFTRLQHLRDILAEYEKKCNDVTKALENNRRSWIGRAGERLAWPLRKARVKEMRVTMEGFKSSLNGWLNVDVW